MGVLITDHPYTQDPFGHRDACDHKQMVDGRNVLCGQRESNHMTEGLNQIVADYLHVDPPAAGEKRDDGKPRWDLLPWSGVAQVVDVITFGAKKYAPNGWKSVPDPRNRYFAALVRHLFDWWSGKKIDPESGLPVLAHAACDLLFLMWFDNQ